MAIRFYLDNRLKKSGLMRKLHEILERKDSVVETSIFECLAKFLNAEGMAGQWAHSTMRCWRSFEKHLLKYNSSASFSDFDEDGISAFISYLRYEQKLTEKTVKKYYIYLKWFLGWSIRKGYTKDTSINTHRPKFKIPEKPVIFLTKEELLKLYCFPIPPKGTTVHLTDYEGRPYEKTITSCESLKRTRDLFCFCAFTSLRYSDMAKVRRTDISDNCLHVTTQKTNDRLPINLNAFAKEILDRYRNLEHPKGLALPVISNQRMNKYLKELCEICGFNSPISRVYYRAGQRICETKPKWKMIGTHAARRTFICFALSSGIPPQVVMKWTGHSDYKTMRPYIDVAEKTKSEAMQLFEDEMKK